jgi:hypothetical protein
MPQSHQLAAIMFKGLTSYHSEIEANSIVSLYNGR